MTLVPVVPEPVVATSRARAALVLGIDEAGRGPWLGPMVVAAVALDTAASRRLARAGVADSKAFGAGPDAHQTRSRLAALIRRHAAFAEVEVCHERIVDDYVERGALNVLERERAERLIAAAPPCRRIWADGRHVFGPLRRAFAHLRALDRAEDRFVTVAAASILAKVRRDELFGEIAARYAVEFGPVGGGGYINAATRAFVAAYRARYGTLPPEARRSWTVDESTEDEADPT